jgi:hypothetical protein
MTCCEGGIGRSGSVFSALVVDSVWQTLSRFSHTGFHHHRCSSSCRAIRDGPHDGSSPRQGHSLVQKHPDGGFVACRENVSLSSGDRKPVDKRRGLWHSQKSRGSPQLTREMGRKRGRFRGCGGSAGGAASGRSSAGTRASTQTPQPRDSQSASGYRWEGGDFRVGWVGCEPLVG